MNGEESLRSYEKENLKHCITKVNDRIYHFQGFGYTNAAAILADHSVILVDALGSVERGEKLRAEIEKITDKPVKTILYTRDELFNTAGAGAFKDTVEDIYVFENI